MQSIREILDTPTRKAIVIIFGLILVSIWFQNSRSGPKAAATSENGELVDAIIIPKINANWPVNYISAQAAPGKIRGMIHVAGSANFGSNGNVFLTSPDSLKSSQLSALGVGDDIIVSRDSAQSLVYSVIDIKIAPAPSMDAASGSLTKRKFLTLQTPSPSGDPNLNYLILAELK